MTAIRIEVSGISLEAELNQSETARRVSELLPLNGSANVWGEEIYFEIPLRIEQAPDARAEVSVGELGFWPVGNAFCIFFGPTPASTDDRPRAYSPVNVFGRVTGDARRLKEVQSGAGVSVTRI